MIIGDNFFTAIGLFSTCCIMAVGLLATYPAVKAYGKGRNFVKWYLFSILLLPVSLVASHCIKKMEPGKTAGRMTEENL